jgi:hypothetical protein
MLNFFRKIRRTLLDAGKPKSYLKYAIGEIFLVMIGILLALQVNNWNEIRKEKIVENDFLIRFQADLHTDTITLNQKIKIAQAELKSYNHYIHESYEIQENKEDFSELMTSVNWDAMNLILQNKTYVEITSSGKVDLIEDKQLKELIVDYYVEYEVAANDIAEMNQTGIHMLLQAGEYAPYFKYLKYKEIANIFDQDKMFSPKDWEFINNPDSREFRLYENAATYYTYKNEAMAKHYKNLLHKATKLLEQIKPKISV